MNESKTDTNNVGCLILFIILTSFLAYSVYLTDFLILNNSLFNIYSQIYTYVFLIIILRQYSE